ncbi:uncharacterized protein LOC116294536 [Actinia tenebrosa]|uniref:Uncharacterized protein LOC116294536 n=1 Tax=Actinia tenebrosa TaxID=6105 RepID=A0A6P8HNT5_ACTTE|nr:uncharacterized protein LOC116294536 [Actinia tenebrosa]
MKLCDELVANQSSSSQSIVSMSSSVSKIKDLYESIIVNGIIKEECKLPRHACVVWFNIEIFTFEGINRVLKPKIHSEGFEDVIEQTAAIVRRDPENKHFICATVLSKWLKLLEISSVTNWFAAQVAKHDLVVHLESSKEGISISGNINDTSLICQVFDAIKSLMGSDDKYECFCEKERLIILFNFPEVFRLLPKACIKLIQSTRDVCTKVIEDIFSILANNLTKNAATKGSYPYHFDDFGVWIEERAENFMLIDEHTGALDHKKLSLNAITQALLTIPDKQQVLKILQIWKQTFPDDKSHRVLSELFVLVIEVIELKRESIVIDMENLVIFLTECRTQLIHTLPLCRTLLPSLMNALPNSWYHPENINVMKIHFDKMTFVGSYSYHSVSNVDSFLTLLKSKPVPEKVKTNILQLGMDLLGEVNYANGYSESISPLTLSLLSLRDNAMVRRYALELLKIVEERGSALDNFYPIMNIINAIGKSCLIERKQEMLEEFARLLKGTREGNETAMLSACREFLKFSVNEKNTKRFFVLAATGSHNSYQFIVTCLNYNQEILKGHTRVNCHVNFLLKIITEKLTSHAGHLELLTKVCDKCILRYDRGKFNFPTIEIFETMVATVSHDIAVSEFDVDLNEATLRVTIAAVDTHRQDPPIDFHSFYVDLNRAFRESKHFKQQSLRYVTMEVLCLIAKLPFTLKRIKCLIQRFMAIFDQDITHDQEVLNVLFKLLQMNSNGLLSSLDDNDVYLTFEKVLVPTNISSSNASVRCSDYLILDHYKAIIAFEQTLSSLGLSSESNHYMAQKKEKNQDSQYSSFTSEFVEAITKRVWETNLKEKDEDFKQMMLPVPPILTPLIGRCLKECYKSGFNDQPSVKTLTEEVLENAGSWRKLEIEIDAIGQILSKLSPDEKLGPLLVEHMRQCYILGIGEKPSSKTVILSILKGFEPWKKLKNEIMYIEKEVINVSPDLVPYTSTCAEECRNSVDVGEEPNVKSLTLQILKSFEFHKRLEIEIEKMEKELSPDVPEIVPSIAECMRQCYIAGLNEEPKIKPVILQMFEVIDQWKELYAKISGCSELAFLVMACIRHWYVLGLNEEGKRTRDFIVQIIEAIELFTWNDDEMNKVNKSCLNIPKQLYLIFKEAKHNEEAKKGIVKAFDVVRKLDPSVHAEDKSRESLIQLDFYLLLKESSVTATDVCSAMLIRKGLDDSYLLDFSTNLLENEYDIFDPVEGYMDLEIFVFGHACASEPREKEKSEFPSPGYVAYLVLNQLRRLGVPDSDLRETTQNVCNKLLCYAFRDHGDRSAYSIYGGSADDKLRFSFNLMNESSYLAEFEYWLSSQKPHHFVAEYDDVIIKAVSWKKGRKSCEEAIRMNEEVYRTLSKLHKLSFEGNYGLFGVTSEPKEIMGRVLKTTEQEDIAFHLFHLLCKSATATETCLDIIPSWNEQESLSLVERLTHLYDERGEKMAQRDLDKELEVGLKILPFAARKFPNSASKTISFLENIIEHNCGHEDNMSLKQLPLWYMEMTKAGYDPQAIESWCTSLVHTQDLSSRDVDAITNMTPENIKLLNKESDVVGKCLFSVETTKTKEYFKHRLILDCKTPK